MNYTSCLNCNKRYQGCYSNCSDYKEYKEHLDRIRNQRNLENKSRPVYYKRSI